MEGRCGPRDAHASPGVHGVSLKVYACPGGLVQTPSSFRMWIPGRHAASVCTAFTKSGAETSTSSVSEPASPRTLKKNTGIGIVFFPHTPTIWVQALTSAYCSINRANTADGPSSTIILLFPLFPGIPLLVTHCFLWCNRGPWP